MKNLIKFELRKILTKRFAVISVAAVLLLSLILSFSTLHSMYAFDGNGTEETGKAAVEIDKQIALKYEGKLTDNKVQQMMSEFKPTQDLHGMNAKYIYQNALQSSVFSHFADIDGSWNGLSVADVFGDKEIKVGYVNGWLSTSQNMAKIFIVLSLVIILLIAPVFSGEYGGVDNIILTSKYGKTKCATAKVLASLLSAVFITTLVVIFNLLIAVAIYGTEGLDCSILFAPIDFLEGYIPFNITCGTVLKYQILLAFMSAISVTGIVLILSAVCKSQMIAFVISAAIHVIPIMLPISETSALYRIIVLMPLFYSQYISIMSVEQMHNGMLYAVWSIPVAIALVVIGSIISHHIKAGKEMFAAEGAFGQFLLCFRNFPVTIGITAGTTAERIPDICLAYIKEAFQQRSAAPELRAEHSRNLKKKTADLSLAFPKGEHAQWEVDNWMLMNQKFSFSENPRGIQEALFLQENDNLEIWLKIDGEEKQLTAGFRKWIRNDLYPGNFRHQYHCLAYAFDGSALRIKVALINTSYVETYTLRPTVAGDSATAIHPQLTCSWQPNVTYLPPAPDNTWHFTATRKPE